MAKATKTVRAGADTAPAVNKAPKRPAKPRKTAARKSAAASPAGDMLAAVSDGLQGAPAAYAARLGDEEMRHRIAEAAYYRAERRGFAPGGELVDWLEAEREMDSTQSAGAAN